MLIVWSSDKPQPRHRGRPRRARQRHDDGRQHAPAVHGRRAPGGARARQVIAEIKARERAGLVDLPPRLNPGDRVRVAPPAGRARRALRPGQPRRASACHPAVAARRAQAGHTGSGGCCGGALTLKLRQRGRASDNDCRSCCWRLNCSLFRVLPVQEQKRKGRQRTPLSQCEHIFHMAFVHYPSLNKEPISAVGTATIAQMKPWMTITYIAPPVSPLMTCTPIRKQVTVCRTPI